MQAPRHTPPPPSPPPLSPLAPAAVQRFGWMLCFWNFAGVPFTYCSQSLFIHYHPPGLGWAVVGPLTVVLLFAYYVWDTSQSQKNFFR
jgi:Delta24(24(1))-sterol reductase